MRRLRLHVVTFAIAFIGALSLAAPAAAQCDLAAVDSARAEFTRLTTLRRFDSTAVTDTAVSTASLAYVTQAEACFEQLYGRPTELIDEDGVRFDDGLAYYNLTGKKWGSGTPYAATGADNTGPRTPGGTVTYSFMGDSVDLTGDSVSDSGTSLSIASLPGYSACFLTDIGSAFAAWSAVANIQFVQVADNGAVFNAASATGDIRIGAHTFDGPTGTLAHAYYPPPNGSSASGDVHFDRQEAWGCTAGPGVIDIGIVALHEIGHALGLAHETRSGRRAVMNPTYNPSVAPLLLGDDINAGISIYGSSTGASDDLVLNFGAGIGLWRLNYGVGWSQIHSLAVEDVAVGDIDGSGVDDVVVDFGSGVGIWLFMNNATWVQVHGLSPARMTVGDLDGNGRDDVILDFAGYGLWAYYNGATWGSVHPASPTSMTAGNIDGVSGDDLILSFAGYGVWSFRNNTSWVQMHGIDATRLAAGQLDSAAGADDVLVGFAGYGLYQFTDATTWTWVNGSNPVHLTVGDLDADLRDDLVVDFGPGIGVYTLRNGTTWAFLHPLSAKSLTMGDLDGNGQDDVTIDFGAGVGVWAWVNSTAWIPIHGGTTVSGPIVGDFN